MNYPNFYENLDEALRRLRGTVVLYDKEPYYILTITNHRPDGIFRVYMMPLKDSAVSNIPVLGQYPHGHNLMGPSLDQYMTANPTCKLVRKQMNSPLFNKFRPFPLGMCNYDGGTYYVERNPTRPATEQGLTANSLAFHSVGLYNNKPSARGAVPVASAEFTDTIIGKYPTPKQVLDGLTGPYLNEAAAFSREFALIRGPIDTLFLQYKHDVVGFLPSRSYDTITLNKKFNHVREAIQDLNLFYKIN